MTYGLTSIIPYLFHMPMRRLIVLDWNTQRRPSRIPDCIRSSSENFIAPSHLVQRIAFHFSAFEPVRIEDKIFYKR